MPNRLAQESSPYLLQHRNNPVDWHPWDDAALALARRDDRPIFLSVGYSACHWCHVMEHESFENPHIADLLNRNFVCIKVDREERPDIDQIYMGAVQLLTGRGGWPMSVFLTPDLQPFFGGTYWPPETRGGMPGFDRVLEAVLDAWNERRDQAVEQAERLTAAIAELGTPEPDKVPLNAALIERAVRSLERNFDTRWGGFGSYPKFPHPMDLRLLMHRFVRDGNPTWAEMTNLTLDRMAGGGIYDHLGGGFHRYSVDERWLVPHFEKMLYDNALLAAVYADAFVAFGNPEHAGVARETCDYVLDRMTDPEGGFWSTEDADSEGVEGKFYVWTPAEIREVLGGEHAEHFCRTYDVSEVGNFEEQNILNLPRSLAQQAKLLGRDAEVWRAELLECRRQLLARRDTRVAPGKDDKILTSWNALMIEALARCGAGLDEPRYVEAAAKAARFVREKMTAPSGRLLHCRRLGTSKLDGFLDDYAYLVSALIALYEADFEPAWITEAVRLADLILELFHDPGDGGFYFTAPGDDSLIARLKESQDGSVPSSNALAVHALLRLGKLTGRHDYLAAAEQALRRQAPHLRDHPGANAQMLLALDAHLGPFPELVVAGGTPEERAAWHRAIRGMYLPNRLHAEVRPADDSPLAGLFAGKDTAGPVRLYVCENFSCAAPITELSAAVEALRKYAAPA